MAYNPSDLKLPPWILRLLDRLIAIRIPIGHSWHIGMTRAGSLMFFSLLGLWVAALYSGNNLLYLCGAMLSALAITALWQGIQLLRHCPSFGSYFPDYMQAGQTFILRQKLYSIDNTSNISALVHISWLDADIQLYARCHAKSSLLIGQVQASQRQYKVLTKQHLKTSAPLGLWSLTLLRHDTALWVVLPQPITWIGMQQQQSIGEEHGKTLLDGDEYHDLRAYSMGDSPSRIHWRKSTFEPTTWRIKHFSQPNQQPEKTYICVDLRLPTHLINKAENNAAFEALLGKAWYWLHKQSHNHHIQSITFNIGQQHFDCSQPQGTQAAIHAIAAATPENLAPKDLKHASILLSLVETTCRN